MLDVSRGVLIELEVNRRQRTLSNDYRLSIVYYFKKWVQI
jgi:hypothetical protein